METLTMDWSIIGDKYALLRGNGMILNSPQYHNGATVDGNKKKKERKTREEELLHKVLKEKGRRKRRHFYPAPDNHEGVNFSLTL